MRKKIPNTRHNKRKFTAKALAVNKKNTAPTPLRGGYRL